MSERVNAGLGMVLGTSFGLRVENNLIDVPGNLPWKASALGNPPFKRLTLMNHGEPDRHFLPEYTLGRYCWREVLTPTSAANLIALVRYHTQCEADDARALLQALGYEVIDA